MKSTAMIGNGFIKPTEDGGRSVNSSYLVCLRNAWKTHDNNNYALQNLSLSVPKYSIYSILGSSGSGKSSILSCIVGNSSLDSGSIEVKVPSKTHVGYMPQELALYEDLSVKETFTFFGILHNMKEEDVTENFLKIITLLEIPTNNGLIKNLSGGQRRRVSLGISMLNNPELLVLDEPTVGLDSLLRDKIWTHLLSVRRNQRATVIITTHYIEEAKKSDMVCFLKEGKALLEGPPIKLVEDYKTNSLEEIYFMVHWEAQQQQESQTFNHIPQSSKSGIKAFKEEEKFSFRRVVAFTSKSMVQIKRNSLMFYICLFLPGLLFILLREASRAPSSIHLGYINQEAQCGSMQTDSCSMPLSCRYFHRLKENSFKTVEFGEVSEGLEAVKRNRIWALLHFSSNFTQSVTERLEFFTSEEQPEYRHLKDQATVWVDMSNYVISELVQRGLHDSYMESLHDFYEACGWNSRYVQSVVKLEKWIQGKEDKMESTNSAAIPGAVILFATSCKMDKNGATKIIPVSTPTKLNDSVVMFRNFNLRQICRPLDLGPWFQMSDEILYTISLSVGLIFILTEKESGTFLRCKVLGLSSIEMLLSELITSEFLLVPPAILLVCLMYFYWGQSRGSFVWVFLLLLVQLNAGIINGLLIALLTKNLTLALLISTGVATVSSYITGVMWPTEGMHWSGQWLNKLLPVSMSVKSMQVITSRGAGISDPQVANGFINSFLWIALFLLLMRIIIWKQRK